MLREALAPHSHAVAATSRGARPTEKPSVANRVRRCTHSLDAVWGRVRGCLAMPWTTRHDANFVGLGPLGPCQIGLLSGRMGKWETCHGIVGKAGGRGCGNSWAI